MRFATLWSALALVSTLGITVRAADPPPEDFVKAMKDAAAFTRDMTRPEAEFDFAKAKEYVPIVRDAFAVIERYWLARNQEGKYFKDIALAEEMIDALLELAEPLRMPLLAQLLQAGHADALATAPFWRSSVASTQV